MSERRAREALRALAPPGAEAAERRAWATTAAAYAPTGHRPRARLALAVAGAALACGGLALTPPGEAVGQWVRDVVAPPAPRPHATAALPAAGRVLVAGPDGAWLVAGSERRRLGAWTGASWSPHGRFVVVSRGRTLAAITPAGAVRWTVRAPGAVRDARWSPEGFHVVYRSGRELRVVGGDGRHDAPLWRGRSHRPPGAVAAVAPAFRPGARRTVAYVTASGRVEVVEVFTGALVHRSRPSVGRGARAIAWSGDGRSLAVLARRRVTVWDPAGHRVSPARLPRGREGVALAASPHGRDFAVAERRGRVSDVVLLGHPGALVTVAGRIGGLTWSPDGRWVLAAWPSADQWLLLRPHARALAAVAAVRGLRKRFGTSAGAAPVWGA